MNSKLNKKHTCLTAAALAVSLGLMGNSAMAAGEGLVKVEEKPQTLKQALGKRLTVDRLVTADQERYIIKFKDEMTTETVEVSALKGKGQIASANSKGKKPFDIASAKSEVIKAGGAIKKELKKHKMVAATMSKSALNKLRKNPNVESIEVDVRRKPMAQTTPYGYTMVQANQFAQSDTTARKVCIIDTGYNLGHPDLPGTNDGVTGQANNSAVGNWYNDGNGHGTHVAGTIAAYDNNEGVVGVYPGVNMHIVKIFNDSGQWTYASDLIDAITQCQDAGSNVVNMSLGGGSSSTTERNAMQSFTDAGMLLVAAAGNDGNSAKSYPASYDAVMSVAAVDSSENRASYSQYNDQVEIAAPGSAVQSTYPTNTYASLSGTSMATPHVAGGAALVWSYFPQCSNNQIRSALNATAKDKGSAGRDNFYGYGLMQLADAYNYLNTNGCAGGGTGGGGGSEPGVEPVSGQLTGLSGSRGSWDRYTWTIPEGVTQMTISTAGGSGDADLYVKFGSQPQTNSYDCRPYQNGNNEVCTFDAPAAGTWHIGIRAYSTYSGVTLSYSYE
ncbi:S8 family serine peptidase [Alteromonas sp. 07-89-2]|uniref:S8 family serine peptidase n=1 Tax=Alteromonas TaxID=226 RepID=UPI000286EAE4|nr:S8 family serine peptidase [Alteromonas sp. 07-89-2]AFT79855.1 cold-active serine alkaline protease [Alteromonas macleodii str. 'Black Sea 11']NOH57451.1 S8 family serine peptidase [Alteromonas sp. 07-89-2]